MTRHFQVDSTFAFLGKPPAMERTGRNHERIVGYAFAIFTLQLICFNLNTENRERITFFETADDQICDVNLVSKIEKQCSSAQFVCAKRDVLTDKEYDIYA